MSKPDTDIPSQGGAAINGSVPGGFWARPVPCLFVGSGVIAVILAATETAWFTGTVGLGRIRELFLFWYPSALLERQGIDIVGGLPAHLNWPFDLTGVAGLLQFLAVAVLADLFLLWGPAALVCPVVLAAAKISPPAPRHGPTGWFWSRAYPLAVPVAFALLPIFGAIRHVLGEGQVPIKIGLTLATTVILWAVLMRILRRPAALRGLVRACAVSGTTVILLFLVGGAVGLLIRPAPPDTGQPAPADGLPNVLLISIDSLRADHVHCYNYARQTSPTLDAVAKEGVRFETVVSSTSWTLPAHLTLLTSLPPERHGVVGDRMRLGEGVVSLAQVLWQAGYSTAGFVSGPYMQAEYGFARGFDHYDDHSVARASHLASHEGITSPKLVRLVREWLGIWDLKGRARPFFVFLHMWDVHYDYTPPPPYDTMFDPDYRGTVTAERYESPRQVHKDMDPRDLEHIVALYDGEIRFTDLHVGRLLDYLRDLGLLDDTVLVITADHGDEFFEHGNKGHKKALYDETIVVPLILRYPKKVPTGKSVPQQVRLMDVAPTILSLCGLQRPAVFGAPEPRTRHAERDLLPLITGQPDETFRPIVAFGDLFGKLASLRTGSLKLIAHLEGPVTYELYDLAADPGEKSNIIGRDPSVDAVLAQRLTEWRRAAAKGVKVPPQRFELSDDLEKRLRSLGYID